LQVCATRLRKQLFLFPQNFVVNFFEQLISFSSENFLAEKKISANKEFIVRARAAGDAFVYIKAKKNI
jgi:hypothetical protein